MLRTVIFIHIPYICVRLVIQRANTGAKILESESWLCHCITVRLWTRHMVTLLFSFINRNLGVILTDLPDKVVVRIELIHIKLLHRDWNINVIFLSVIFKKNFIIS